MRDEIRRDVAGYRINVINERFQYDHTIKAIITAVRCLYPRGCGLLGCISRTVCFAVELLKAGFLHDIAATIGQGVVIFIFSRTCMK